jgi:hypothetical protein
MPLQNSTTLAFIICLAAADVLGYLLHAFPTSALLWALNLNFANFFWPLLHLMDERLSLGLVGNLAIYGAAALLCVLSLVRRSRLLSAAYCHGSLAAIVILTFAFGPARMFHVKVADGSSASAAPFLTPATWEAALIVSVAIALVVACIDAHIAMMRRAWREIRSHGSAAYAAT